MKWKWSEAIAIDLCGLLGAALVLWGLWRIYPPLLPIAGGALLLMCAASLVDAKRGRQ